MAKIGAAKLSITTLSMTSFARYVGRAKLPISDPPMLVRPILFNNCTLITRRMGLHVSTFAQHERDASVEKKEHEAREKQVNPNERH